MTIKIGNNLIETDDRVPISDGPTPDTCVVRIKNGENWNGNMFSGHCDLQIPRWLLKDESRRA
jgi:hypothetical protein